MNTALNLDEHRYGTPRLTVELANICNLHCSYCFRDDEALYNPRAEFLSLELLRQVIEEARRVARIGQVNFTGGEPTLHPEFSEVIDLCAETCVKTSFVTNGWHFEKVWPALLRNRDVVTHVAFSIDGATQEAHDRWRGEGSFVRLIRAFTRCENAGIPFSMKAGIRSDTIDHLEAIALFAARMGASSLSFAHLLPTSAAAEHELGLDTAERKRAEEEIAILGGIFKMKVGIDVGYYNVDTSAPCLPLAGTSYNIDYKGRLTLCCNLSGFRGAWNRSDIVADLNETPFSIAYERAVQLAAEQLDRRKSELEMLAALGESPDIYTASPCLFCLKSFGNIPWRADASFVGNGANERSLPVLTV